jgi:hypothetical protein
MKPVMRNHRMQRRSGGYFDCSRSAARLNGADDLAGQLGVGQKLVDQRGEDLLAGHPGHAQPVCGVSLPDVKGPMGGDGQVDGAAGALGTGGLVTNGLADWLRLRLS